MKKAIQLVLAILIIYLNTGCATRADIVNLQSQINGLKILVAQKSIDTANVKKTKDTVSAIAALLEENQETVDGVINPGHPMCVVCDNWYEHAARHSVDRLRIITQELQKLRNTNFYSGLDPVVINRAH